MHEGLKSFGCSLNIQCVKNHIENYESKNQLVLVFRKKFFSEISVTWSEIHLTNSNLGEKAKTSCKINTLVWVVYWLGIFKICLSRIYSEHSPSIKGPRMCGSSGCSCIQSFFQRVSFESFLQYRKTFRGFKIEIEISKKPVCLCSRS